MKLNMKKAFTLVEMLIVIVIIGILAAALIPRLTGVQSRARDVARTADIQQISTALTTYQLDNGYYPTTGGGAINSAGVTAIPQATWFDGFLSLTGTTVVNNTLWMLVFEGLLKALPIETNSRDLPYQYKQYNAGQIFSLMALSEGGGLKANFASGYAALPAAGIIQVSDINNALCISVTEGAASYVSGAACKSTLTKRTGRYVLAN